MDNSDDYFDEADLVIDEATEAAIAESERQYASQALPTPTPPPVAPVTKRQRTTTGWTPGIGGRQDSFNDMDYPDITIQNGGYYPSLQSGPRPQASTSASVVQKPPLDYQNRNFSKGPGYNGNSFQTNVQAVAPTRQPQRHAPSPAHRVPVSNHQTSYRPQGVNRSTSNSNASSSSRQSTPLPQPHLHELQQLRQQLAELQKSNSEMGTALKAAWDAKIAKEGEVTILRKTIDKNSQTHAAEVARLKAAKQEADAKQLQMQKTLKEDMERLKTQLAFKQQELEVSLRKPPPSVRPKKALREPPATPLPPNSSGARGIFSQRPNFSTDVQATPSRPTYVSPKKALPSPKKPASPVKPKKPAMLPGFQNSFTTSTQLGPAQLKKKGKERERPIPVDDGNVFGGPSRSQSFVPPPTIPFAREKTEMPIMESPPMRYSPPAFPEPPAFDSQFMADQDGDVHMVQHAVNEEDELMEDFDPIDPPDWKAELCRIILTHIRPGNDQPTFQQLLAVSFSGEDKTEEFRLYTSSWIAIMDAISQPNKASSYEQCVFVVANSFVSIIEVLTRNQLVPQLAILFNLLATLTFFLPKFRGLIFGQDNSPAPESSPLIRIICKLVTTELGEPSKGASQEDLGRELLGFLEAMCFELPDEDTLKFSELVRTKEVMMTLLSTNQPAPFLEQVVRILAKLSIRKQLCWALLSIQDPDQEVAGKKTPKNNVTERLCSHLVELKYDGPEFYKFRENILVYFTQLSLSHSDVYSNLSGMPVLLASVLWHIATLATPIWEDDERLIESPANALELVQYIERAVYFMHYLMFSAEHEINLGHKLQQAPPRPFNSVLQLFIVTFGRLTCAEPPDWLEDDARMKLEQLTDMARDIFELVAEGPDADDIWQAYQDDPEDEKLLDEEEMEAQMVDAD